MKRTRFRSTLAALSLSALAATACSSATADTGVASLAGDDAPLAAGSEEAAELSNDEALLAFTACMRDEGIDVADPVPGDDGQLRFAPRENGGGDVDRETQQAAQEVCGDLIEGAIAGGRGGGAGFDAEAFLTFATCMRDNGIDDFPDPGPEGRPDPAALQALDTDSDAFTAASATCADETGFGGRIGGGGPGGGGRGPAGGGGGA